MKKVYNLLMIMLLASVTVSYGQAVTVTNGGFESGIEEGWGKDLTTEDGAIGEFLEEATDVQEGAKALKVYVDELGLNDWSTQIKNETFAVEAGKSYEFSMWFKDISEGDDTVSVSFTSGVTNAVDTWIENSRLDYVPLTKEWQKLTIYFTPAAENLENDLFAYMSTHFVAKGICLIDNFTVNETQNMGGAVSEDMASVYVDFVAPMADPAGNEGSFDVKVNGTSNAVTAIAIDENELNRVLLTLTTAVTAADDVVVTYTPGTLATSAGTEITAFTTSVQDGDDGAVSVIEKANNSIALYPNPASSVVNFNVENAETVEVYNVVGKLVTTASATSTTIDVSKLDRGVYFVVVTTTMNETFSNKIMVE